MKISVTIGQRKETSDMMFDKITIDTTEKRFTFANATIQASLSEVYRYYDAKDIINIELWRAKL